MNQLSIDFKPSFFNTIGLTGQPLADADTHMKNQEERILYLFRTYDKDMSPSEVYKYYQLVWPVVPITSIRRGMSNLTRDEKLEMLDELITGLYGYLEHKWRRV